jgi:hypothetical protein
VLKKTITYTDYDGKSVTEDFYFHFSKAELAELENSVEGGISKQMQAMLDSNDQTEIMNRFREILSKSVGRRSEDGRRFMKSAEISADFMETEAYSALLMELMTDNGKVVEFITAMMPGDLQTEVAKIARAKMIGQVVDLPAEDVTEEPKTESPFRKSLEEYTDGELSQMPLAQLEQMMGEATHVSKRVLVIAMRRATGKQ